MSNVPWSVKGVEHEAREAAKLAARKAGLPLGVWLSQTIHATAAQQLKSSSGPTVYASPPGASSAAGDGAANAVPRPPALTPEAVLESINRLSTRLAESEARTAEALAPIVEKVAKLSAQVEQGKVGGGDSRIDIDPLERAMMRMTERLDRMEDGRGGASRPADRPAEPHRRKPGLFSRLFSD